MSVNSLPSDASKTVPTSQRKASESPPSSFPISSKITQENLLENNNNPATLLSDRSVKELTDKSPQNIEGIKSLSQQKLLGSLTQNQPNESSIPQQEESVDNQPSMPSIGEQEETHLGESSIRQQEEPVDHQPTITSIRQQGGHARAFEVHANGTITKTTSEHEVTMYSKIRDEETFASLQTIIPGVYQTNQNTVMMENLTQRFENPCIIDIKLGKKTFSKTVDEKRTGRPKKFKKLKQKIVDWVVRRDFRVVKGSGFKERYVAAKNSENTIRQDINDSKITLSALVEQLEDIQRKLDQAPVAFYGHSLLFVMGKNKDRDEQKCIIKLIDIGHYLTEEEASNSQTLKRSYDELRTNTRHAIEQLKTFIANLNEP
ncbi:MAG: inositol polyphosphate kinase family protein [Parachlamydiaceae bacterium]